MVTMAYGMCHHLIFHLSDIQNTKDQVKWQCKRFSPSTRLCGPYLNIPSKNINKYVKYSSCLSEDQNLNISRFTNDGFNYKEKLHYDICCTYQ
jgi:hypothetical protein